METRATDSKAVTKLQTTSSKIEKSSSGHLISLRGTHHLDGFIVAVNCDGHRGTGMEDAQIEELAIRVAGKSDLPFLTSTTREMLDPEMKWDNRNI
ncbi:hypothetical protein DKX38_007020 [Salix brachista]|uniref:Uncharacterized protein n=1 Tax=Salix brachista TaxID=2182728 RepID=A0A5N5MPL0_9ROSI|nr:hypothetical protein DKX38_007020 [Salix brachista]